MIQRMVNTHTTVGVGDAYAVYGCHKHTWQVIITGSPTNVLVLLEGSIDNINWFTLGTSALLTNAMGHFAYMLVLYIRSNVITLTGGTNPTIKVTSISGPNDINDRNLSSNKV